MDNEKLYLVKATNTATMELISKFSNAKNQEDMSRELSSSLNQILQLEDDVFEIAPLNTSSYFVQQKGTGAQKRKNDDEDDFQIPLTKTKKNQIATRSGIIKPPNPTSIKDFYGLADNFNHRFTRNSSLPYKSPLLTDIDSIDTKELEERKEKRRIQREERDRVLAAEAAEKRARRTNSGLMFVLETGKQALSVHWEDYYRLEEGEFLNDTVIEFFIRYHLGKSPQMEDTMHAFNSFFYHHLSKTPKDKSEVISYDRVKKWTKNVDVFDKKFLFIPINENFHWYMAIICNPGKALECVSDEVSEEVDTPSCSRAQSEALSDVVVDKLPITKSFNIDDDEEDELIHSPTIDNSIVVHDVGELKGELLQSFPMHSYEEKEELVYSSPKQSHIIDNDEFNLINRTDSPHTNFFEMDYNYNNIVTGTFDTNCSSQPDDYNQHALSIASFSQAQVARPIICSNDSEGDHSIQLNQYFRTPQSSLYNDIHGDTMDVDEIENEQIGSNVERGVSERTDVDIMMTGDDTIGDDNDVVEIFGGVEGGGTQPNVICLDSDEEMDNEDALELKVPEAKSFVKNVMECASGFIQSAVTMIGVKGSEAVEETRTNAKTSQVRIDLSPRSKKINIKAIPAENSIKPKPKISPVGFKIDIPSNDKGKSTAKSLIFESDHINTHKPENWNSADNSKKSFDFDEEEDQLIGKDLKTILFLNKKSETGEKLAWENTQMIDDSQETITDVGDDDVGSSGVININSDSVEPVSLPTLPSARKKLVKKSDISEKERLDHEMKLKLKEEAKAEKERLRLEKERIREEKKQEKNQKTFEEAANTWKIICFDSLGLTHSCLSKNLRTYLTKEALDKKKKNIKMSVKNHVFKGELPKQPNSCDCGVYLLLYFKKFTEDPDNFFKAVMTGQAEGLFTHEASVQMRLDIMKLMMEHKERYDIEQKNKTNDVSYVEQDGDLIIL